MSLETAEQVRVDQQRDARSRLTVKAGYDSSDRRPRTPAGAPQIRKPFVAKGHDAILKAVQDSGGNMTVTLISTGDTVTGKMVGRDRYTITIMTPDGRRYTFYKHAIESFCPETVQ